MVPRPAAFRGSRHFAAIAFAGLAALCGFAATAFAQEVDRSRVGSLADDLNIVYDSIRIEGSVWRMEGDVDISDESRGLRLLADAISVDIEAGTFEATGNVSFEQGGLLLNGSAMRGDIDDATLEMNDAIGVAPGPFYIRAKFLRQLEPGKFEAEGGIVTPCNQTSAIWEFRSGKMTFKLGSHVKMSWPHLRVKGLPLFGLPWVYWPLQDDPRQTGLLIPAIGSSSRKGFMISESFFWAISRSADLTLTYENYAQAGSGFAGEFRHVFGQQANGSVRAYYFPGRQRTDEEEAEGKRSFEKGFALSGEHIQTLPGQFVLRVGADYISSTQFARDFQTDVNRFLQRSSYVNGEVTKSWGANTVSVVANSSQRFNSSTSSTVGRKLPMARYNLRSTQLTGPVYVGLQSSAARLQKFARFEAKGEPLEQGGTYSRFDAFPEVSVQLTQIPWLTFNPFFRWRSTYWSHQADARSEDLLAGSLFRHYYETGLEMVGPSLFKIYEAPGSEYSPRFKHVIQPRLTYRRIRTLDYEGRIIRFDEIDSQGGEQQALTAEVTMRLFGKRYPSRTAEERMVSQLAEFTVGRDYNLDTLSPKLEDAGAPRIRLPWFVGARISPTDRLLLDGNIRFTPALTPASYRLSVNARGDLNGFQLTWFRGVRDFYDPDDLTMVLVETTSNTLSASANGDLFDRVLTLRAGVGMDLFQNKLRSVSASVQWNLQCCSVGLDLRKLNFTDRTETQFALILNLAQVGSLGFDNNR
jgi:LPS-assembly protein